MDLIVEREEVWAASLKDEPGALASILSSLTDAGADLDFVIVRRAADKPGTGVVFVTPLRGDREVETATEYGFSVTSRLHSVRVEAPNEKGILTRLTKSVADAGVNVRGLSAAALGTRAIIHFGLDSADDERKVIKLLSEL